LGKDPFFSPVRAKPVKPETLPGVSGKQKKSRGLGGSEGGQLWAISFGEIVLGCGYKST